MTIDQQTKIWSPRPRRIDDRKLWSPVFSENNPGPSTSRQNLSNTPSSGIFAVSHRSTIDVPPKVAERGMLHKKASSVCDHNTVQDPGHSYPLQDSRTIPNRQSYQTSGPEVAPPSSEPFHVIYHTTPSHKVPYAYPRSQALPLNSTSALANGDPPYNPSSSSSSLPIPIGRPAPRISAVHAGPSSPQSRSTSQPSRKALDVLSPWSWPSGLITAVPLPTPKSWFDSTSSSPVEPSVSAPGMTVSQQDPIFDLAHLRVQNDKKYNPHTVETMTLMNPLRASAPVQYRVYVSMIKARSTNEASPIPNADKKLRKLSSIPTRSREYCNQSLSARGAMWDYLSGIHSHTGCDKCAQDSLCIRLLAINHYYRRRREAAER